jgi:FkbH-like protein
MARDPGSGAAGAELLSCLKAEIQAGNAAQVADVFPRLILQGLDYTLATSLHRVLKKLRSVHPGSDRKVRIAVLGTMTTHQLVDLLDLHLQAGRIAAQFYEAEYSTINQEFLDPESGLHRFQPQFILIVTSWRDLKHRPGVRAGRAELRAAVDAELDDWAPLWRIARDTLQCQVIQSNFVAPPWRILGNLDARHPAGFSGYVARVNQALVDNAPSDVTIHDVDHLAALSGRWRFSDDRFYHHAKLPCSPELMVDYAHSLASLILVNLGILRKCLVLDLDNTLWGGVIGDDGIGGIKLGQGDAEGEAFVEFQKYVKALGERGVILAVCSKNDAATAREVFEKHPEMVLRLEDISCFVANWDDKASNIARISEQLNIGLNSLVFFDDNPAERSIVRQRLPDVAVPEVPESAVNYIHALDRNRYFEALALSDEDLKRTEFYKAESKRETLQSAAVDLDSFLRSLDMVAAVQPVNPTTVERTAQLINRSNQFNLTTRRYTAAEVISLSADPAWITRTISLRDRFGDNGLISVLFARIDGDALVIDTWLMSCRVLKRGVELLLLDNVVAAARERGLSRIIGEYIPSAKNALVRDHYQALGFTPVSAGTPASTRWELRVDAEWRPGTFYIAEKQDA